MGDAVVQARQRLEQELEDRRQALADEERRAQLGAERLDLTETLDAYQPRRGHLHVVTQGYERLEDVFKSAAFLSWQRNGAELQLFLDSVDECLLRVDAVERQLGPVLTFDISEWVQGQP